ncbi:hypothetical protein W02_07510 [Nitrospira sp. KM1]|uniref:hypothetical protein n=1 Tax=Nitrospira sp. KM1 TaxID=1936990 RepID=UPI0013A7422D|nr:hypothetical protein [Nitrospira sp. KM1]BCA53611.1 hypothetical protein W02_07510 [Nitrospira sp. KM1]
MRTSYGGSMTGMMEVWLRTMLIGFIMCQSAAWADESTAVLMKQQLDDMAGRVATVLIVSYAPGAASDVPTSIPAPSLPMSWKGRSSRSRRTRNL